MVGSVFVFTVHIHYYVWGLEEPFVPMQLASYI